jgi:hypothetical protein
MSNNITPTNNIAGCRRTKAAAAAASTPTAAGGVGIGTLPASVGGRLQHVTSSSRPTSTRSSASSSASNSSSFDWIYPTHAAAVTGDALTSSSSQTGFPAAAAALVASPYQVEISRLRLDQLRIEEEHLLEQKRQSELERTRGPQPKWYEMRSSQFHREIHRNNELLKHKNSWQALLDYRSDLESASINFLRTMSLSRPIEGVMSGAKLNDAT